MGIIASCCATAACSCCVGVSFSACGFLVTISRSVATRVWYSTMFLVISFIAYFLSLIAYDIFQYLPHWIPFLGEECTTLESCSVFTIYRITFGLFLYHIILSLVLIGVKNSKDIRSQLNNGWWALKIPMLIFFIIGSFLLPGEIFTIYAWFAVFGAGIFILIQLILLIDLAYGWNESWVANWNYNIVDGSENKNWYYGLLGCSLFFLLSATVMNIMMYIFFCRSECWYNPIVITINIILCILLIVLSVHPKIREFNDRIGLLQASIFTLYCTYYISSAILSEPNSCSELPFDIFSSDTGSSDYPFLDWFTLIFGAIFTVVSVVYASLRVGSSSNFVSKKSEYHSEPMESLINDEGLDECDAEENDEHIAEEIQKEKYDNWEEHDDEKDQNSYNYSLFHLAFALGSMYVGMLLTNWSIVSSDLSSAPYELSGETDSGWVAVSVKLVSVLVAFGLYAWSIFAPVAMPNRNWE